MYAEDHPVNDLPGTDQNSAYHASVHGAFGLHFDPNQIWINGLDPTNERNFDALYQQGMRGNTLQLAAETGDPQRDRDAVHIGRGILTASMNPWPVHFGRLPADKFNFGANYLRQQYLGLPQEGPQQVPSAPVESQPSVAVSGDMSVTSKWTVVALGELQQPGGVGATQDYNPVTDGPNPDGPSFGDNAGNSQEQEVALETWVNMAVDMINRGETPEAVLAQLAHDGCPNPQEVLARAQQQPMQDQQPVSDEIGQDPFEAPAPSDAPTGQMQGLSQQPPTLAKRVRIAGTTMTGTEIDRWESMWGEGQVKIALDEGGTITVSPEAVEATDGSFKHPVTDIQSFIDSMPEVQPTRPHIEARLANLDLVHRAIRSNISSVGFSDQVKLDRIESQVAAESALLKEVLSSHTDEFEIAYAKARPRFQFNAFKVADAEVTPWAGRPREAGAIWAKENFDIAVADNDSFVAAAAHYASRAGMTGSQFQEFLAGAEDHRIVRTEEFTAEEPVDNDGPAEALFV